MGVRRDVTFIIARIPDLAFKRREASNSREMPASLLLQRAATPMSDQAFR